MTEQVATQRTDFEDAKLSGARFYKTHLDGARFRMSDLSGAQLRDVSLSDASIDGCEIDGLVIDGVEVAPLIQAELTRREPARGLRRASDPDGVRAAWAAITQAWDAVCERVAAMPAGTPELSVSGEWSLTQTLRHLLLATDTWLGAATNNVTFHPWGMPFTDMDEFIEGSMADLGIDVAAAPSYDEVKAVRADLVATVAAFLADITPERLAQEHPGPEWAPEPTSALRCLRVIFNEELEHLRFAKRDLDLIEAGSPLVGEGSD